MKIQLSDCIDCLHNDAWIKYFLKPKERGEGEVPPPNSPGNNSAVSDKPQFLTAFKASLIYRYATITHKKA